MAQMQMVPNSLNPSGTFGAPSMAYANAAAWNMTQMQMLPSGVSASPNFVGNATQTMQWQAKSQSANATGNFQPMLANSQSAPLLANAQGGQLSHFQPMLANSQSQPFLGNAQSGLLSNFQPMLANAQSAPLAKDFDRATRRAQKSMMNALARNAAPIQERMRKRWKNEEVLKDIDNKLDYYILRHKGKHNLVGDSSRKARGPGGPKSKELQILERMRKEEEAGALALPAEEAAQKALRSGLREYVDYAVDEVKRYADISKTGEVTADFDWSCVGDHHDVPAMRRSHGANRVDPGLDNLRTCSVQAGLGSDDMFDMDFLRDFCARGKPQISSLECEQQMRLAVQKVTPAPLIRADNKAPLFLKERKSKSDLIGSPIVGKFGDREWAAKYSMV